MSRDHQSAPRKDGLSGARAIPKRPMWRAQSSILRTGEYEDGPGRDLYRHCTGRRGLRAIGCTIVADSAVSVGLQLGVPLEGIV